MLGIYCTAHVFGRGRIRLVSLATGVLLAIPHAALAHPESGFLPDAVAEMEYKMAVELNPRDIATRSKLGIVLYRKNKLREAEREFAAVLKIAPNDFDAHDGMGLIRIKERKYTEAVTWFTRAIALRSDDTMVHYNLGFTYEQMGRLQDAASAYARGAAVNYAFLLRGVHREAEQGKRTIILTALKRVQERVKEGKKER